MRARFGRAHTQGGFPHLYNRPEIRRLVLVVLGLIGYREQGEVIDFRCGRSYWTT